VRAPRQVHRTRQAGPRWPQCEPHRGQVRRERRRAAPRRCRRRRARAGRRPGARRRRGCGPRRTAIAGAAARPDREDECEQQAQPVHNRQAKGGKRTGGRAPKASVRRERAGRNEVGSGPEDAPRASVRRERAGRNEAGSGPKDAPSPPSGQPRTLRAR